MMISEFRLRELILDETQKIKNGLFSNWLKTNNWEREHIEGVWFNVLTKQIKSTNELDKEFKSYLNDKNYENKKIKLTL
jgi:hypothetical protein